MQNKSTGSQSTMPPGITSVGPDKLVLTVPPDRPPCGSLRYSLGNAFQADPRTCGVMVMRMTEETPNYGFLDGSDVVLLDELKAPAPNRIFAATRNEFEDGAAGKPPRMLMKSPLIGGFVPLGALRADGTTHPHAGTGFGIGQAHWFPFKDGCFSWVDPGRQDMNEVYQLAYDGRTFTTRRSEIRTQNGGDPLRIGDTGWSILVSGYCNAIPDGDDLLSAVTAARDDGSAVGNGVVRWTRRGGAWRPAGYDPVTTAKDPVPKGPDPISRCPWMEPSLARGADDCLLFTVRDADSFQQPGDARQGYRLRAWRMAPGGCWGQILDAPDTRLNSPVTINTAADGSAYMVSAPYNAALIPETDQTGRGREKLVLWPLAVDGTGIGPARLVLDCLAEFGAPPSAALYNPAPEKWMADHANSMTVRLKDGLWHHLLTYRVCHSPRYRSSGTSPSPHSGCYVEELTSRGPVRPVWRFADGQ